MVAVSVQTAAEILVQYLDCVLRRDHTAVESYFHPDIEYVINGSPPPRQGPGDPTISAECIGALPWLGHYRGKAALRAFLEHMHRNLDLTAFGERRVISKGDEGARSAASNCAFSRQAAVATARTPYTSRCVTGLS
jgi:ketosteroid isomerase-like protein